MDPSVCLSVCLLSLQMQPSVCLSSLNLTCFTSSDPAAVNATKLYDGSVEDGHIWYRETLSVPLPFCPPASEPQCSPCYDQEKFFIVCRNVIENMDLVLEGEGGHTDIERCGEELSVSSWFIPTEERSSSNI